MWLAGSNSDVALYIATDLVALDRVGNARQVWADQPWCEGLMEAIRVLQQKKPKRVSVWLSGGLARPFLVPPASGLKRWGDVVQLAQGLAAPCTQLTPPLHVWIGRWRSKSPSLAVAVEKSTMDSLTSLFAKHSLRLGAVEPAWRWVAEQANDRTGLVLVNERDACTGLQFTNGMPVWTATYSPPPRSDATLAFMARIAFAQNVAPDSVTMALINHEEREASANPNQLATPAPPLTLVWQEIKHAH